MFKKGCMKTAALFITVVMLSSIVKAPVVYAYFTAEARSETLNFQIKAITKARAEVSFIDPFLFEDEASQEETGAALQQNARLLKNVDRNVLGNMVSGGFESLAGRLSGLPQRVQAAIYLEDGFDVADIDIISVRLHYDDHAAFALGGELDGLDELNVDGVDYIAGADGGGADSNPGASSANLLIVDFDREEIARWFEGTEESMEYVTFVVAGEGLRGGQERFRFAGEAELLFKGSYGTKIIEVKGPDGLFIPSPGETTGETFTLENQDEEVLEGARWALRKPVAGVKIDADTGSLKLDSLAPEGDVTVLALLQSEGRFLIAEKQVALYAQPELKIYGAEAITIPPPQRSVGEEYRVEVLSDDPDVLLTEVSWELQEGITGVNVDDGGRVTVGGETAGESFTLLARLEVAMKGLSLPLTLQKQILLETVVVGSLEIFGETQLVIPDGGATEYVYEAAVYDPEGVLLAGEPAGWYLKDGSYGVNIGVETGILTVDDSAAAGSITVVAVSERDAAISAYKTVNLEEPPREEAVPPAGQPVPLPIEGEARLQIEGGNLILIPVPGEDGTVTDGVYYYTAQIFDGEGNLLEGAEFTWSLSGSADGVFLSDTGELIVTGGASAGTIQITATSVSSPGISATYDVEILADADSPPAGEEPGEPEEPEEPEEPADPEDPEGSAGEEQPGSDEDDEEEEEKEEEEEAAIKEDEEEIEENEGDEDGDDEDSGDDDGDDVAVIDDNDDDDATVIDDDNDDDVAVIDEDDDEPGTEGTEE